MKRMKRCFILVILSIFLGCCGLFGCSISKEDENDSVVGTYYFYCSFNTLDGKIVDISYVDDSYFKQENYNTYAYTQHTYVYEFYEDGTVFQISSGLGTYSTWTELRDGNISIYNDGNSYIVLRYSEFLLFPIQEDSFYVLQKK